MGIPADIFLQKILNLRAMVFVDTHTHCVDEAYRGEEDQVIARAVEAGVVKMIQADICSRERNAQFALCEKHPGVLFPMLGLYPGEVDAGWQQEVSALEPWFAKSPVAIGEIGLDYHFDTTWKEQQKEALRIQLEIAASKNLPVNIHLRDATEDFLAIIKDCAHLHLRGNLHAFSGSVETFRALQKWGDWSVGIGGVVTFKNSRLPETVKEIPLDRILLETDAPYLAPTPLRGTRNESANIPLIAAKIAEIKGCSIEEVAEKTTENAHRLFAI